jgi:pyrroloquinoline-quinone synthase
MSVARDTSIVKDQADAPWDRAAFEGRLRDQCQTYHDKHPFHLAMNQGGLTPAQIRGWVANRFHYQRNIPIKDAVILSNCPDHEVRRGWVRRILVHDGQRAGEGGIEAWLRLGEAVGLSREELLDERLVLPGVRSAVDDYVRLARDEPWPVAVASSLTELFAPDLMAERIRAFERYYTWVPAWGMEYFRARLTQARVDSDEALELTLSRCTTRGLQERAVAALGRKCRILWSLLDAIMGAYGVGPAEGSSGDAGVSDRVESMGGGPS